MSSIAPTIKRAPVFFISHGGPNLLEDKNKPGEFYTWLGKYIKNIIKPKAIVVISAHWQGKGKSGISVDSSDKPALIYDFYGFPKHYYSETWDQQGEPELASRIVGMLQKSGIQATAERYGNDHGVWVPLKRAMRETGGIPIVEVSTFSHENLPMHISMGEALAPLRDENILIIGSGSSVHNLRLLWSYGDKPSPKFVIDFDRTMEKYACTLRGEERNKAASTLDQHPNFRDCHPTAEHLVPFHVALGAAGEDRGVKLLEDYFATLGWGCFGFGLPEDLRVPQYSKGFKYHDEL
ncbi:Extradiol ring-cleavage dioxygenase, class III enzyme, subunit B [Phycomyces nitens]|nr:Extradiol ring-cleavage dioxygenase, class III enzyme, subunit B [Phycomyces nitens]